MGTVTAEQLSDLTCEKIKKKGLFPGDVIRDEGFTIVRIKDDKNRVLSSVTFADSVAQMDLEAASVYLDALVLERCRAAVKEPVVKA